MGNADGNDGTAPGERLARVLAALAAGEDGSRPLLERMCAAAPALLEVDGAAVSVVTGGRYAETLAASDEVAAGIEDAHVTLAEGPGLDAYRDGRPVIAAHLAAARPGQWPAFTQSAMEVGVAAVFAFPIRIGAIRIGVLGLYRATAGPLVGQAFGDALLLADFSAQAVLAIAANTPGADGLGHEGGWWAEVHQATGMISAQLRVSIEEAFVRLQARAYGDARLIRDVGRDVVARRLRFEPDD